MRIIQVVNVRWFNATAWYGLFLSRLLKEAGHAVTVLGLAGTESFAEAAKMGLTPLACDLNSPNPLKTARALRKLGALVRNVRPHIVNCHRGEGMLLWGALRLYNGSFALVRTRGDQRPPKANLPNKWLYGRAVDAVIAANSTAQRQLIDLLGLEPARVAMLPGGVDRARFAFTPEGRQTVRAEFGFTADETVLGLLGRFDTVKGQKELIEAVARIRAAGAALGDTKRSNVRLMLAGFPTSTSQAEVEGWIRESGLSSAAVITGKCADVAACISAMDIGVIASQGSEAIARAAFEIMSCNVPLVGTNVGVMPDLLSPTAMVIPGDAEGLERLLCEVIMNADIRETLRKEQEERIQSLTAKEFLRRTLDVYCAALASAGIAYDGRVN